MGPMAAPSSTACARCSAATARPRRSYTPSICWHSTGRDLRGEPWYVRRDALTGLLRDSAPGIRLCEHIEDADGAVVFRAACNLGLEGIVAKRRDSRYHSGRSRDWIKVKNMAHPAIERAMLIALSKQAARRK